MHYGSVLSTPKTNSITEFVLLKFKLKRNITVFRYRKVQIRHPKTFAVMPGNNYANVTYAFQC